MARIILNLDSWRQQKKTLYSLWHWRLVYTITRFITQSCTYIIVCPLQSIDYIITERNEKNAKEMTVLEQAVVIIIYIYVNTFSNIILSFFQYICVRTLTLKQYIHLCTVLKWQCHEIIECCFFHKIAPLDPIGDTLGRFQFLLNIHGDTQR